MEPMSPLSEAEKTQLTALVVAETQRTHPQRRGRKRTLAAAVALVLVGAVAGGAVSAAAFSRPTGAIPDVPPVFELSEIVAFERAQNVADALPTSLPDYATNQLDLTTSRFVGDYDGSAIYVVQSSDDAPFCVLIYPKSPPTDWVMGCGDGIPLTVTAPGGLSVKLLPRNQAPDGWTPLDANVSAMKR